MPRLIPGQLAKVDNQDRLCVPLDLLKAVSWWSGKSVRVVAELTAKGLVRIHLASAVEQALLVDEHDAHDSSEKAYLSRAVLVDRYRELALYKDGRLRMTKEVCPWLGFRLGEQAELYVQPFPNGLEVMTMEYRFERLAGNRTDVLPWALEPPIL